MPIEAGRDDESRATRGAATNRMTGAGEAVPRDGPGCAGSGRPAAKRVGRRVTLAAAGGMGAALLAGACEALQGQPRPAGGGAIKEPVTIEFLHRWDGVREPLVAEQVRDFAAIQPNVIINNQMVFATGEGTSANVPVTKIMAMILAGTPPDVFMIWSTDAVWFARRGALHVVDDLLKRDRIAPEQIFYAQLLPFATYQGKRIGLPQLPTGEETLLFFNPKLFRERGLDPSKSPKSWDDLVAAAQKLTRRIGDTFETMGVKVTGSSALQWATRNNAKVLSPDATRVLFDSRETLDTLEWLLRSTRQLYGSDENYNRFLSTYAVPSTAGGTKGVWYGGKEGMYITGVWHFFEAEQQAPQFEYGAAPLPYNAANSAAKSTTLGSGLYLYVVGAGSKKVDAAWEWLTYITMGEGNRKFMAAQKRLSPVRKFNEEAEFGKANPYWGVALKTLDLMTPLPQTPAWPKVGAALGQMQKDVLSGKAAPRAALSEAARAAQQALDEEKD